MKFILVLASIIIPATFALPCRELQTCNECDSYRNEDGEQACSWCTTQLSCVPISGLECVFGKKIKDKDDCPVKILNGYGFNETLSKKMLLISYSSYGNNVQQCLDTSDITIDVTVTRQITTLCDDTGEDDCSGFAGVSRKEKAIILAFRGTMGNKQLFMEAEYVLFKHKTNVIGGGAVCKYFYDAFAAVWNSGMSEDLKNLISIYHDYELWVTGHSMGAALATIAANVIAATKTFSTERMKVITYGEPRVGDREFVTAHDKMLPYKYRVTHRQDMVTHVPPKDFLNYRHHRYEVWYNNDMNPGDSYSVCLSPEDSDCSDKNFVDLSWKDHTDYYGYFVDDYKSNRCQSIKN